MKRILLLGVLLGAGLLSAGARLQTEPNKNGIIVITGATVIDGAGSAPQTASVVIRGERIEAVAPTVEVPPGARVINGEGLTLIPGLFDLHTHLPYATENGITGDWPKNLKAYLYCGVTSVVDFGTYPETFEPMRRLVKTGIVEAPRISYAARLTTPGGHGAEGGRGDLFSLEVSTPREARAAIRRVLPYQPDVIKVFTDGWRYGTAPEMTSMNEETLTALVEEAHQNGLAVLTHTVTLEKAKIAARAGVDVIAHGIGNADVDQEIVELIKTKATTYAPTLAVYEPRTRDILTPLLATVLDPSVRSIIQPPLIPLPPQAAAGRVENAGSPSATNNAAPEQVARLRRWQFLQNNTAALRRAGISFGTGTDAGVTGTHHGWATLRELELLVAGGLTPLEAIQAATGNAARAIKVDGERGTIKPGKLADLVLVAGSPHLDIHDLQNIKLVFLGGREIDREKLAAAIASPNSSFIPAIKAQELIDDFESANGRSAIDTLWVNSSDSGVDHSKMIFGRTFREPGNYALTITARMSDKERPFARINVPLSRGAVEPVDARQFRGIRFDVRGDGAYRLILPTYRVREIANFQTSFTASPQWQSLSVEFSSLRQNGARNPIAWSGDDLLMISIEIARPAGSFGWLEIDNLRFF